MPYNGICLVYDPLPQELGQYRAMLDRYAEARNLINDNRMAQCSVDVKSEGVNVNLVSRSKQSIDAAVEMYIKAAGEPRPREDHKAFFTRIFSFAFQR
jgi:hypothetical protein